MGLRMSGIVSGFDTESMVKELVKAHQTKIDSVQKKKTKLEWKKEAWNTLNSKVYDFYNTSLSKFKSYTSYKTKSASVTDDTKAKVTAENTAITGSQTLSIFQVASSQFITGSKIGGGSYTATSDVAATSDAKFGDINHGALFDSDDSTISLTIGDGTNSIDLSITKDTKISDLKTQVLEAGIDAYVTVEGGKLTVVSGEKTIRDADSGEITSQGKTISVSGDLEKLGFSNSNDSGTLTIEPAETTDASSDVASNSATSSLNMTVVKTTVGASVSKTTKLSDLGINGTTFEVKVGGKDAVAVEINETTTLTDLATKLSNAGIQASYDDTQGRFFLASKSTGADNEFTVSVAGATNEENEAIMGVLGLADSQTTVVAAQDSIIELNGARMTSSSNTVTANGLTVQVEDVTGSLDEDGNVISDTPIKMTVATDTDTIYNMVKDFKKAYNSLIADMYSLYSAKSADDYEPLTDEEKESLSDDQIEKWETKIKDSILRRDSTINDLLSTMRSSLNSSVTLADDEGNDKKYTLSSFGIVTGLYTERGALHIEGDTDDADYSEDTDKLRKAINEDPDKVMKVLAGIGSNLYTTLQKKMAATTASSAFTFYDDKTMQTQIDDYADKINTLEDKLSDLEDRYYAQFTAMETAMSKLNSQQSALAGLLGSNS